MPRLARRTKIRISPGLCLAPSRLPGKTSTRVLTARHFLIRGRVQGVGFRYFAWELARREGLSGYIRNQPDGVVEAMAEGDLEAVDRFERGLRMGPPAARIEDVQVDDVAPTGRITGFSISD